MPTIFVDHVLLEIAYEEAIVLLDAVNKKCVEGDRHLVRLRP